MWLIAVIIYIAIAGVVMFALACAAARGNGDDVAIEHDAELVELALARRHDVPHAS